MKNASLKQIALLAAAIIGFVSLILLIAYYFFFEQLTWFGILVLGILSFGFSFFIIHNLVDEFIYRRIKVIYKNIHQLKTGKNKELSRTYDPLSDVEKQVQDFSANKSQEIAELKKMEQYRREFLGDVSHELKTPIFNTQGYIETLLNGALENPKVNVSYLKKASKNLDRLSIIVDNLLKISESESGKLQLNKTKFDIVKLVQEVFEAHEMMADGKDIQLLVKKENPSSKLVFADRAQIEVVLNNLVSNAIKYGNSQGKVWLGIYNMEHTILVEITDDGPGIEQQHLPRLFDRFYRIDKHRSRFDGGNGLGLAICKHILEAHEQSIHVRSTVDIGTTFGFTLSKV